MFIGAFRREVEEQHRKVNFNIEKTNEQIQHLETKCYEQELKDKNNEIKILYKIVSEQMEQINSVNEINNKLLEYIDRIEEVKNSGGIDIIVSRIIDPKSFDYIEKKVITIPQLQIAIYKNVGD